MFLLTHQLNILSAYVQGK